MSKTVEVVQVDLTQMTAEQRQNFHKQGYNMLSKSEPRFLKNSKSSFEAVFMNEVRKNAVELEGLKC